MSLNNISLINLNSQFNPFYSSINIDSSGNVGIGKSNPLEILDVSGNIKISGNIIGSGYHLTSLNATNITSGVLSVNRGGTGATTLTAGSILVGNGTSTLIQPSNLTWNSATNSLSATNFVGSGAGLTSLTATNITGNINVSQGGTGLTTLTAGSILVGNGTSTLIQPSNLTWNSTTNTLSATNFVGSGTGLTSLTATNITGNINVSQGGTGLTTLTAGRILIGNGTSALTQTANLTWDNTNNRLGIGITNPQYILDIQGVQPTLRLLDTRSDGNAIISFKELTDNYGYDIAYIGNTDNKLYIRGYDNSPTARIDMTFDRTTGNVGIGTTTPNTKLDVNGNISLKSDSASSLFWGSTLTSLGRANGPGDFSSSAVAGDLVLRSVGKLILQSGTGIGAIVIDTSNNINIDSGILYIDASNNNVGIGTTQPNKKLHVTGDTRIEGSLIVNGTVTQINTNVGTTEQLLITNDGTGPALIVNQTGAQPIIEFQDDGSTCFKIFDGGNLGIGTASKIVSVDISGNLKLSGSITGSGSGLTALNASNITGNINVAQGGTGLTTLTAGQLLIGGTNVIQTSNLTWNSSTNTLSATNFVGSGSGLTALNASNITGNINVAQGGTGLTTLTSGQILIGGTNVIQTPNLTWNNGTNTLSATNFVGSGSGLTALNATNITGNINVAQGGTGATTLTSGQILVGNGTSTLTQSANLTWDNTNNRLGIGKTNPGYVLDVNGAINATELRTNGTIFTGSIWTIGTSNKIYYNTANIGIGTTDPLSLLDINATNYTGALLTLDAGIINATTQMARSIGKPLMKIGKTSYSTTAGDYYGIGFGYSPTSSDFNCAEIGTIITSVAGKETGDIVFSTRPDTTNVAATERMRIWSNGAVTIAGNVCIGKATPSTALDVVGTVTATLFSGSGASLTSLNASNISSGTLTAANGGTGCTSLSTVFFDTSGGVLSLKNGGTGSSQWTTLNNNIYFNTANVGIGITNPNYKLHVEDGILFIGDSMFLNNSSSNIANNYILLFDNTYNGTTGSGIAANKIRLMNDTSNNILAGFGIENNSITYHSGSSGSHTFYSGTSSSNYGTGRFQIDQSGNITCTGDFAAFTSISDKRLKTNIIKLDSSMDIIKKLNPVKFFWKYNDFIIKNKQGTEDVGFIAQEIEEVIPLATGEYKVINSEETYKNIKYERIIPYLVKSIQELIDKVDTLEQEIIRLKCYI